MRMPQCVRRFLLAWNGPTLIYVTSAKKVFGMFYVITMGDKTNTPTKRFSCVLAEALQGKYYDRMDRPEDFSQWCT